MTTRRRRYWPAAIVETIEEKIAEGWSAKQIREYLEGDPALEEYKKRPDTRTIQRMISERAADESGSWEPEPAAEIDPAAAFPVLSEVVRRTEGRVSHLSRLEARWVSTLLAARANLPPWETYRLARLYIWRRQRGEPTADLDAFLAFAPWQETQAEPYISAIIGRLVPTAPTFLLKLIPGLRVVDGEGANFTPVSALKLTGEQAAMFKEQLEETQDGQTR